MMRYVSLMSLFGVPSDPLSGALSDPLFGAPSEPPTKYKGVRFTTHKMGHGHTRYKTIYVHPCNWFDIFTMKPFDGITWRNYFNQLTVAKELGNAL